MRDRNAKEGGGAKEAREGLVIVCASCSGERKARGRDRHAKEHGSGVDVAEANMTLAILANAAKAGELCAPLAEQGMVELTAQRDIGKGPEEGTEGRA
jgi:hypothetical protein